MQPGTDDARPCSCAAGHTPAGDDGIAGLAGCTVQKGYLL